MLSEDSIINKIYEPFILGKCRCGCNEDIEIYSKRNKRITFYKHGHFWRNKPKDYCKGELNINWKGGKRKRKGGYISVLKPDHPYCDYYGYVYEHRLVMEEHLGRYLDPKEIVHHIDHDVENNKIENLMLFDDHSKHIKFEVNDKNRNELGRFVSTN